MKITQMLEKYKICGKNARTQTLEIAIFVIWAYCLAIISVNFTLVSYTVMLFGTFSVT